MKSTMFDVKRNGMYFVSASKSAASTSSIVLLLKTYNIRWQFFSLGSLKLNLPVLLQKLMLLRF